MEIGYKYVSTKFRSQEEASMHLIVFLIIGGIAGALAGRVVSGHGYGVLMDVIVGVIGAFIGGGGLLSVLGVSGGGVVVRFVSPGSCGVLLPLLVRVVACRTGAPPGPPA